MKRPSKTLKMSALCALIGVGGGSKAICSIALAVGGTLNALAVPGVSNVVLHPQQPGSARLEVSYDLEDEPGIITFDVLTNGVSIGLANVSAASGDVNRLVLPGARKFIWRPDKSWPGHVIEDGSVRVAVTAWATNAPPNVMVVDLSGNGNVSFFEDMVQLPGGGLTNLRYRTTSMAFRKIPARGVNWRMGSPETELGRGASEALHWAAFSEDYYMGVYPVTQKQFALVCNGSDPSSNKGDLNPVEKVLWSEVMGSDSWPVDDAVGSGSFMGRLRAMAPLKFILPTEAQWEYACRAGCGAPLYTGKPLTTNDKRFCPNADEIGWFGDENKGSNGNTTTTRPVGLKAPNAWGLHDMVGNVNEYCLDWHGDYDLTSAMDPKGAPSGSRRVVRGGDWWYRASHLRSAYRQSHLPTSRGDTVGFRVACPAVVLEGN